MIRVGCDRVGVGVRGGGSSGGSGVVLSVGERSAMLEW